MNRFKRIKKFSDHSGKCNIDLQWVNIGAFNNIFSKVMGVGSRMEGLAN